MTDYNWKNIDLLKLNMTEVHQIIIMIVDIPIIFNSHSVSARTKKIEKQTYTQFELVTKYNLSFQLFLFKGLEFFESLIMKFIGTNSWCWELWDKEKIEH